MPAPEPPRGRVARRRRSRRLGCVRREPRRGHRLSRVGVARRLRADVRPRVLLPDRAARPAGEIDGRAAARRDPQPALRPHADLAAVRELRRRARRLGRRSRGALARRRARPGARRAAAGTSSCGTSTGASTTCRASSTRSRCGCRLPPGMWERLDRKVRNQIRKAEKSELTVERGGAELLADFYTVFARNMRDLGTPVYARRLFEEVLRRFRIARALIVVRLEGRADRRRPDVSGPGTMVEVPWASSIRDFNRLCPNHLLYWHVIETAVADGCDDVRLRPVDAGRRARTSSRSSGAPSRCRCTGSIACCDGGAFPIRARRTRSSGWRSRRGSGCRCGWRTPSARTSSRSIP